MVILMWLGENFPMLKTYLSILPFDGYDKFSTAHLVGWLLFGTLYCYIASYPILVFHAIRIEFFKKNKTNILNLHTVLPISLFTIFIVLSVLIISSQNNKNFAFGVVVCSVCVFSLYQIYYLYKVSSTRLGFSYAKRLTQVRNGQKDFVESYRHLREHGNTALIILFEILLAAVLYVVLSFEVKPNYPNLSKKYIDLSMVSIILFIWVAPATLVYFYGQFLERKLSQF
ncbi:hypothetical protein l11_12130 [Neisseria weaveri LMG 5135]|nr:hypothetical protein l11_12130 [Neisseria weaveri LMG 5135]